MDRGSLNVPGDSICEWLCFCCSIFYSVVKVVCCNSLCNIFLGIAERFMFEVEKKHGSILSNVFFFLITIAVRVTQAIQLIANILKRAKIFRRICNNIFILCRYHVLLVIVFIYLQDILTVHTLMFLVKPYLSALSSTLTYHYLSIYQPYLSLSTIFFYRKIMPVICWKYDTVIYTNNNIEENGGNVSLRALVFAGMKNFSVDLNTLFVNAVHFGYA